MKLLVLLVIFLKINFIQANFFPDIISPILDEVVIVKGTAYLNCTLAIRENQKNYVEWWYFSPQDPRKELMLSRGEEIRVINPINPDNSRRYAVRFLRQRWYIPARIYQAQVYVYQLIISGYLETYPTRFKCAIQQTESNVRQPLAYGKVTLISYPMIYQINQPQIYQQNATLDLTCRAGGNPQPRIAWVRAGGKPFSLPGKPGRILTPRLYIPNLTRRDRGVYRCHAYNNVGKSIEYDHLVEVNYRPVVRQARIGGQYAQAPDNNYQVTLECIVNGYPDPDLFWYRGVYDPITNNKPITNDERYDQQKIRSFGTVGTDVQDVFMTLRILNIKELDYGMYTCRAKNNYGEHMQTVELFRQMVCQGAMCPLLSIREKNSKQF